MRTLLLLLLLICGSIAYGQIPTFDYIDTQKCRDYETYKGKKKHGQKYCVSWYQIRIYRTGKVDTIGCSFSGRSFSGGEYESYQSLTKRNQNKLDSLKEDGLISIHSNYLMYEPRYMEEDKKVEQFYGIMAGKIIVYTYLLEKNRGFEKIKEIELK